MMCEIFGRTQALSCMMQSSNLVLLRAVDMIEVTRNELADNRKEDAHFDNVWTDAMSLCQHAVSHSLSSHCIRGQLNNAAYAQGVSEQTQVATLTEQQGRVVCLLDRFNDSIVMVSVGDLQWLMTRNHSRPQCICRFLTICAASLNVVLMRLIAALCEVSRL